MRAQDPKPHQAPKPYLPAPGLLGAWGFGVLGVPSTAHPILRNDRNGTTIQDDG
jgi:hypothetical protein